MLRLLKIECTKIYNYKTARIFIVFYFVLLATMGFLVTIIKPSVGGISIDLARYGAYIFPYVWQNVTYFSDFGAIFLAIIIITNITNEYTYRTLKQNLIDGLTKKEFLLSKVFVNLIFATVSTVLVFFTCLGLGLYYTDNITSVFAGAEFIFTYFLKLNIFFAFCTFLAFWIRRSGFAFMMIFMWIIGERIIFAIESFNTHSSFCITRYLPSNAASNLLPFPSINLQGFLSGNEMFRLSSVNISFCFAAIIYTAIFIGLSYWLLKKRDL